MKKVFCAVVLTALTALAFAGDLKIKSGNVYQNFVISGAAPNGIRVFYNNGDGDREVILPVSEFPDELSETVNRIARKIPEERKKAQEEARQAKARKDRNAKRQKAQNAKQKKSGALVKKEQDDQQKIQESLMKKSGKGSKSPFKK